MPLEGQAERVRTPLRPRDRHVLAVLGLLGALAIVAGSVYAITRRSSPSGGRCVSFTVAASVGGSSIHQCGAGARHYCRVEASERKAVEACRRAGFPVGTG